MGIEDFANHQVDVAKHLLRAAQELLNQEKEAYAAELQRISQKDVARSLSSSAAIFQIMARIDQAEQAEQRAKALVAQREQEAKSVRR